jgi:ribosomal peptide maturation radical SAM protein 1
MQHPDILLVNMPWAPMIQPSLALGLLQAILRDTGTGCRTVYANLDFTAEIGEQAYRTIIKTMSSDGLRDWVFGPAAFPDFRPDDSTFLRMVFERNRMTVDPDTFERTAKVVQSVAVTYVKSLAAKLITLEPRIIGCTSSMNQHVASLALLRYVRELDPGIITMIGGANCEDSMGQVTHESFRWIDYVVTGDADGLIVPLVEMMAEYGREIPLKTVPEGVLGPVHRKSGYPAPHRVVFDRLDDLPIPDFDDYFSTLDTSPPWLSQMILPSLPAESSRGCWWSRNGGCTFCGIDHEGRKFESKKAERVLQEFAALESRYNTGRIQTTDNVMDRSYYRSLLPLLAEKPQHYNLFYEVRPTSSNENVRKLAEAGIRWIWAGIESLNSEILSLAGKGLSAWENLQFLKACRQNGIYVGWNLMCDFPREKDEWYVSMADSLSRCTHLQPPAACTRVRLDRFSDYHRHPEKYGLRLRPARLSQFIYPLSEEDLNEQVYFFEDDARWDNPLFDSLLKRPGIRAVSDEVSAWQSGFYSENPASLEVSDNGRACRIFDSRPGSECMTIELEGIERELLMGCTVAPEMDALIHNHSGEKRELHRAIANLVDLGLVLLVDGHAVGLPLWAPVPALPAVWEYPGGGLVSPAMRRKINGRED